MFLEKDDNFQLWNVDGSKVNKNMLVKIHNSFYQWSYFDKQLNFGKHWKKATKYFIPLSAVIILWLNTKSNMYLIISLD